MTTATLRSVQAEAPVRLGFGGGGTDLPSFYKEHGPGVVTSISINRFIGVTVVPHFDPKMVRANYRITEELADIEKINHNAIREALKMLRTGTGVQISSLTDVPSRGTGLGSGSTFIVALLHALHTMRRDQLVAGQLAREAYHLEREVLHETGGKQDQYMAEFGGAQCMTIANSGVVSMQPLDAGSVMELQDHVMVLWTGIERDSEPISRDQSEKVAMNLDRYIRLRDLGYEARNAIESRDWRHLGEVMDEGWEIKGQLANGVTNSNIESFRKRIKGAGAYGFRITGAGGGGFGLVVAEPERFGDIRKAVLEWRDITIGPRGQPGERPLRLGAQGSRIKSQDEW